jgi:hypothetical protein
MEMDGIGESVVTDLKIVEAAARRLAKGAVAKRPVLSSWSAVIDYCRAAMAFADKEQFRLLFLDKRNALIADEVQQSGTVDHTPVYPREALSRDHGVLRSRPETMKTRYDPELDVLHVRCAEATIIESEEVRPGRLAVHIPREAPRPSRSGIFLNARSRSGCFGSSSTASGH